MAKKNRIVYVMLALFFVLYGSSIDCLANSLWREVENRAFQVGEKLTYIVKWKGVAGGSAVMQVKKIVKISGRDAYYVTLSTRSSKFFDLFYKVRDLIESYIDKQGIFTWKQRKKLRGGKYRSNKETIYDQQKRQALHENKKIDIPVYVQDSLSSVYYLRTQELTEGDSLIIDANDDGKNYSVEVKVIGVEKVTTPSGKYKALKTEVVWKREGKVHMESSQMWLSNDERKIPVKIEKQSKMGTITMVLKKAKF
ncbi:DUF3108 domain-containing protein [bacterium]|nr:DUF3108 domain-containing protein [bacterium]NIN92434.1 DUF3108 domain-containing protein [bacterium]NIO18548.1 DUF3108 domain-containing protein [bacterium]NIO73544.1 DUF3108 domain-containing protein [bacterium]